MTNIVCLIVVLPITACVGSPKPQQLPKGRYVGTSMPSLYESGESVERIEMPYQLSESSDNGKVTIYDAHKEAGIFDRPVVATGTWHTIINGENGITQPCFTGIINTVLNSKIQQGWKVAIVNCWLQEDFIPNSYTFQGQLLVWNPLSTINYAEFGTSIFIHIEN